jgi:hypothetical protein
LLPSSSWSEHCDDDEEDADAADEESAEGWADAFATGVNEIPDGDKMMSPLAEWLSEEDVGASWTWCCSELASGFEDLMYSYVNAANIDPSSDATQ